MNDARDTAQAVARLQRLADLDPASVPPMPPIELPIRRGRLMHVEQVEALIRRATTARDQALLAAIGPDVRVLLAERDQARQIARGADREWSLRYRDTNGETWVSDLRFTEAGARHEATLGFDSTIDRVEAVYRRLGPWTAADDALPDWLIAITEGEDRD